MFAGCLPIGLCFCIMAHIIIPMPCDPTNPKNPKKCIPIPSHPCPSRWRISRPCFRSRASKPSTASTPGFLGSWPTRASPRCRRASGGSCFSAWRRAWEKGKGSWRRGSTKGSYGFIVFDGSYMAIRLKLVLKCHIRRMCLLSTQIKNPCWLMTCPRSSPRSDSVKADSRRQGREGFSQLLELAHSQGLLESVAVLHQNGVASLKREATNWLFSKKSMIMQSNFFRLRFQ